MKFYLKYLLIVLLFCSLITGILIAASQETITIKGSTIMYKLNLAWAKAFMQKHPSIKIDIEEMASGQGINQLLNRKCDIAATSGRITSHELVTAAQKGIRIEEFYCGFAMYTIAVNPDNPVDKLTQAQVYDIFTGNITNWAQVGGKDMPIKVIYRQPIHSVDGKIMPGVYVYDHFLEGIIKLDRSMLNEQLTKNVEVLATPKEIAETIANDPDAISYLFFTDATPNVKALAIKGKGEHFIKPTVDNVLVEQYPYLRPLYFYVNKNSLKKVEPFIEFIQSAEGAKISKSLNFVPYIPQTYTFYELIL